MGSTIEVVHEYLPDESEFGLTRDVFYSSVEKGIGIICTDYLGDGTNAENALDILVDRLQQIPGSYTEDQVISDQEDHPFSGLMQAAFIQADNALHKQNRRVSAAAVKFVERNIGGKPKLEALIKCNGTNNTFIYDTKEIAFDAIEDVSDHIYDILRGVDTSSQLNPSDMDRSQRFANRNVPMNALGMNPHGRTSHTLLLPGDNLFLTSGTVYANLTNSEVLGTLALRNPKIEPGIELANRARARSREVGHVRAMHGDITVINFKIVAP